METDDVAGSSFSRIASESCLKQNTQVDEANVDSEQNPGISSWERSQSVMDLKNEQQGRRLSVEVLDSEGRTVSEQSRVYWDLSQAEDEMQKLAQSAPGGGKLKISLQTIRQKEEMQSLQSPTVSIKTRRTVHRMDSNGHIQPGNSTTEYHQYTLPNEADCIEIQEMPMPSNLVQFDISPNRRDSLSSMLAGAIPALKQSIQFLHDSCFQKQTAALSDVLHLIEKAWATPTIGKDFAYGLCDVLRTDGGLDVLIDNCTIPNRDIKLGSAKVLEQSMTVGNREAVAAKGLEIIINLAKSSKDDKDITKAVTGILESIFKHSEDTCTKAINFGGLDSILYSCRNMDTYILRHCAEALANLAMFGGKINQRAMITQRVPEWLFPLAFSDDDAIRYHALLAVAALSANKELESAVLKSGTLELVKPFILTHDPLEFARSDLAHIHGQSAEWLARLVPLLASQRREAQSLAAFHFAMECGIKVAAGKKEIFEEISAIDVLRRVAGSTNAIAAKFACQALEILEEPVPYKLSPQVPLWTCDDVSHWLVQAGLPELRLAFNEVQVDGDVLLHLTEQQLCADLNVTNGITRYRFLRELTQLKRQADYSSCDVTALRDWLRDVEEDATQYTYNMVSCGTDQRVLPFLTENHLEQDCRVLNGVHRLKIMEAAKSLESAASTPSFGMALTDGPNQGKSLDVFISYRRSTGSQLASLLRVHLQLRGFTVFLDIEKLRAGKFDENLLQNLRVARNFVLVLTPNCLDRCVGDECHHDWVHREIAAAIEGRTNIIPVMDNFEWPAVDKLPEDIRPIFYFNGIRWIHDYQDACVDKLEKFITGAMSPYPDSAKKFVTPLLTPISSPGQTLSSPTLSVLAPMCAPIIGGVTINTCQSSCKPTITATDETGSDS